MDFPESGFWDWSLKTYAAPGVSQACLRLQDRHAVDVNVLLYAVWVADSHGVELSDTDIRSTVRRVEDWYTLVVGGLRRIRSELKDNPHGAPPDLADSIREQVKKLELDAEHLEQLMLCSELPKDRRRAADLKKARQMAGRSVRRYLRVLGSSPDPGDESAIETIVEAGIEGRSGLD